MCGHKGFKVPYFLIFCIIVTNIVSALINLAQVGNQEMAGRSKQQNQKVFADPCCHVNCHTNRMYNAKRILIQTAFIGTLPLIKLVLLHFKLNLFVEPCTMHLGGD